MTTAYKQHRDKWLACTRCRYAGLRTKVVVARGVIPCDVLLLGEAPGASEDVIGQPFVGPAGKLLDRMIGEANSQLDTPVTRLLFTNLLGCIPLNEDNNKEEQPDSDCINACLPRVQELIAIANPSAVVAVGSLAKFWAAKLTLADSVVQIHITHPSAILQAHVVNQTLLYQQAVLDLRDLFISVSCPF